MKPGKKIRLPETWTQWSEGAPGGTLAITSHSRRDHGRPRIDQTNARRKQHQKLQKGQEDTVEAENGICFCRMSVLYNE